ncbi:MAG: hypothetical protein JSS20_06755 [Proteobacteria bacterium]|nr:hypothetical protein [Pseudomonadota bacterium]
MRRAVAITGYNAAIDIDRFPALSSVRKGQVVEFNPAPLADPAGYMRDVALLGAVPEWYWVGLNCLAGTDCDALGAAGVKLGSTGTPEWNKTEKRIYDITHPASLARARVEMHRALEAAAEAGSNLLFRIDNLHNLDNPTFDMRDVRSDAEVSTLLNVWFEEVAKLRAAGRLKPSQIVGLTAHNNLAFWSRWIASGRTPPLVMQLENPTQVLDELQIGVNLMRDRSIPLIAIEFERGLDYVPTPDQIDAVAQKVSLTIVIADETHYEGARTIDGPGPRELGEQFDRPIIK